MPEYDAFGREIDPDAAASATPQASARPAGADDRPVSSPPRPSSRPGYLRRELTRFGLAMVVVVALAGVFLVVGGDSSSETRGGVPGLSELERSTAEFEDTIARLKPDPDAPSALTGDGARDALAAIRDEEADGPPAFVAFEPDRTFAGLLIDGRWFGMAVARGQTVTNGLPLSDPPAKSVRRLAWDAIDLDALDRVVEASGGEDEVARAVVSATRTDERWTVTRLDGTTRRFDLEGRPLSR